MSGAPDPEIVRALSVRQPYAELILRGKKRQEYRSRRTNVRERVWLYASLTDADDTRAWRQVGTPKGGLVKGKIIGSVVIAGCKERDIDDFAWVLSDPRRLDVPLGLQSATARDLAAEVQEGEGAGPALLPAQGSVCGGEV